MGDSEDSEYELEDEVEEFDVDEIMRTFNMMTESLGESEFRIVDEQIILSWFDNVVGQLEKFRSGEGRACQPFSRRLLLACDLNVEKVISVLHEQGCDREIRLQKVAGLKEPKKEYDPLILDGSVPCSTCYCPDDEMELYSTGFCDHYVCSACFRSFYSTQADSENTYIQCCDQECKQLYSEDVLNIFNQGQQDSTATRMKKNLVSSILEILKKLSSSRSSCNWLLLPCDKPGCESFYQINKSVFQNDQPLGVTIVCKCGSRKCMTVVLQENGIIEKTIECDEQNGHEPLSCGYVKVFDAFVPKDEIRRKKVCDNDENAEFIKQHTRECPNCKKTVWRDGGCKHLRCTCGTSFCWHCKFHYEFDHQEHHCNQHEVRTGSFKKEVADIEIKVASKHKPRYEAVKVQVQENSFDLAVLAFRFRGKDPELIWKVIQDHNLDVQAETDSGVDFSCEEIKIWDQIEDDIRGQVNFEYTYPLHFMSIETYHCEELQTQNGHLFLTIKEDIENNLAGITNATNTIDGFLRFMFMLEDDHYNSQMIRVNIDECQEKLADCRQKGAQLAIHLVDLQNPDLTKFQEMQRNKGCRLQKLTAEWNQCCAELARRVKSVMEIAKKQTSFKFCMKDPHHRQLTQVHSYDEKENIPPEQEKHDVPDELRYIIIEGTDILWDTVENEPVDMVEYN